MIVDTSIETIIMLLLYRLSSSIGMHFWVLDPIFYLIVTIVTFFGEQVLVLYG